MIILVGALLLSLIPSILLILWLRGGRGGDLGFQDCCNKAVIAGFVAIFPVILCSAVTNIVGAIVLKRLIKGLPPIVWATYYGFIVLALSEELVKCFMSNRTMDKYLVKKDELGIITVAAIVAIAFGLIEDIPYMFGSTPAQILIRGILIGHAPYGLLMGYFLAKAQKTGNKFYVAASVVIPWLIHGLYDFSLSTEFLELGEWTPIVPLAAVVVEVVVLVGMILYVRKLRKGSGAARPRRNGSGVRTGDIRVKPRHVKK